MKVDIGSLVLGLKVGKENDPTVILKLRYIRDNLPYRRVYDHYGWRWKTDTTHQMSCPFHARFTDANGQPYEQNPSARYYDHDKAIWCFACAEGGDVAWFVKKKENHESYFTTITFIGQAFGVVMDNTDLAKRIEVFKKETSGVTDARREIMSDMYRDRINDIFYDLRKRSPQFSDIADKLEPVVFAKKNEIDAFQGDFLVYSNQVRRWLTWSLELVQESMRRLVKGN